MRWLKNLWDRYRDGANNCSFDWKGRLVHPFPRRWEQVEARKREERELAMKRLCELIHHQHTMVKPPSRFA